MEKRVEYLEDAVKQLTKEVNSLKKEISGNESDWVNNRVDDYMIKLVFPAIYCHMDKPRVGFPKNRKRVSEQIQPGQFMFIYATSPIKKIIGLTKVVSKCKHDPESRWPYYVELEWVLKPRKGVTLSECDLDIRPRPGDTVYALSKSKADGIIKKLESQEELDEKTIEYLASVYSDTDPEK